MKQISLLLPTRGRAKLAERFLRSVVAQSTHPELVEVVLCVDEDDLESHQIASSDLILRPIVVPRQTMGAYNAICLEHATGQITIAVNDDVVIRTRGWDDRVRALDARYPDGIYLGYGNDLFKGPGLCTFPILSRETCERLAEPYPAIYKGAFLDVQLMDIFNRLKHRGHDRFAYDKDLIFEHLHYRTNPEAFDATYAERERFGDDQTFIALAGARRLEADRLLAAISGNAPGSVPQAPPIQVETAGPIGIIGLCFRKFLLDFDLPLTWRCYLFAWMLARYYYGRLRRL
jgi:glycosyltransferase involved in cell wall biosynthesis